MKLTDFKEGDVITRAITTDAQGKEDYLFEDERITFLGIENDIFFYIKHWDVEFTVPDRISYNSVSQYDDDNWLYFPEDKFQELCIKYIKKPKQ